jgi:hypothetical protein
MKVDLEKIAERLWDIWRKSPIANEGYEDVTWQMIRENQNNSERITALHEVGLQEARAACSAIPEQMREPTGAMWSAGRKVFQDEAEKYRQAATTVMADAYADKSPGIIWRAMWAAAEQRE